MAFWHLRPIYAVHPLNIAICLGTFFQVHHYILLISQMTQECIMKANYSSNLREYTFSVNLPKKVHPPRWITIGRFLGLVVE